MKMVEIHCSCQLIHKNKLFCPRTLNPKNFFNVFQVVVHEQLCYNHYNNDNIMNSVRLMIFLSHNF